MSAKHLQRMGQVAALGAGLAVSGLGGCAGHGSYTRQGISLAQQKADAMKAATEYDMARQAYFAGDLRKAVERIDRSLAINPEVASSHVLRGRILLETGEMDEALDSLHRAEALAPDNEDAQYFLGLTYERLVEREQALEHYQKAADIDQEDAQYVVAVAEVFIDMGQVDAAEEYILSRRARFEHNAGVRQTQGHIALIKNDNERALEMFSEARLLAPDDTSILEDLARTQIAVEKYGDAATSLAKLLQDEEVRATRRDLCHMYARSLVSVRRYIEARNEYLTLTEGDAGAGDVEAWIGLGNVAYAIKDSHRHRNAANRVMALAPEREEGYLLRALWHRRRGENEDAVKWLDLGSQRAMQVSSTYTLRGVILNEMGRTGEARESFEAALREDPSDTTVAGVIDGLDASEN
ncbi:MAG TPA: tetratricopeptide repeat protein [Phycisphaerales bacterium]|nr:tetratricopeptide repeat protein [Phycisphaerales bacterium]